MPASLLPTLDTQEALRAASDGSSLIQLALHTVPDISKQQLFSWRLHCRQLVITETRHVQATRRLLKLQRASGFTLLELKLMARLCGPYTVTPADAASSLLTLTLVLS